jgi:hypothetical protein
MVVAESVMIVQGEYIKLPTKNFITFTVKNNGNTYVEDLTIEIKYTSKNTTKLILQGNGKPKFEDNTEGFERRPIVIPFYRVFTKEERQRKKL